MAWHDFFSVPGHCHFCRVCGSNTLIDVALTMLLSSGTQIECLAAKTVWFLVTESLFVPFYQMMRWDGHSSLWKRRF